MNGLVFDAGGLIALERNDRRLYAMLAVAIEDDARIVVPATALAQVIRNPAKQVRLWRTIQHERTEVIPLDGKHAQAVGALLARTRTRDIVDAHVVVCAREFGFAVVTGDADDLRRLDPELRLVAL
ncbi:MAG: PIN domain-containing protein [Bryobacteraceae bacterium]|nr:PIN domain-containing protein [Bryobacteraceae bacterium]